MGLCSEPLVPLSLVRCYPIGHITMIDEGAEDIKVVAVPFKEPNMNCYDDISELPPHILSEIKHFFGVYKQLEGKVMKVLEIYGRKETDKVIARAMAEYNARYADKK